MSKKRKIFVIALGLILFLLPTFNVIAYDWEPVYILRNSITLFINGKKMTGIDLFENEGTTYVPIRAVAEELGYDVSFDGVRRYGYITGQNNGSVSSTATKANLMLANLYKDSQLLLISMISPTSGASNTALTQAYMGQYEDAYYYFKNVRDYQLASCISTLEDIIDKFEEVLEKYNLQNNTSYKNRFDTIRTMLNDVKTKTNDFSQATIYFLQTGIKENDVNAYSDYQNSLSELMNLIETYSTKFQTEYETLMSAVVGSDYKIITDD